MKKDNQNLYIKKAINLLGGQSKLAEATSTAQSSVWKWLHNESKPTPQKVVLIVKATGGQVKAHEIRPDLPEIFPKDLSSLNNQGANP